MENQATVVTEKLSTWLTVEQTAAFFDVSVRTVYRWANEGIIKRYQIKRKSFFKRAELEEVLTAAVG